MQIFPLCLHKDVQTHTYIHTSTRPLGSRKPYPADVHKEILKQFPHMIAGVNLLHFHLSIHIAVIEEVNVRNFNLRTETDFSEKPIWYTWNKRNENQNYVRTWSSPIRWMSPKVWESAVWTSCEKNAILSLPPSLESPVTIVSLYSHKPVAQPCRAITVHPYNKIFI